MDSAARRQSVPVRNFEELCSHGATELRRQALDIATVGLTACDGALATRNAVRRTDDGIEVNGTEYKLAPGARLVVLGAGKATLPIAEALEEQLGDRIDAGTVILRRGETHDLGRIEVYLADHPLPTKESVEGALRLESLARSVGPDDLVIACFTGGSSALASLPPDGISFDDKRRLHEMLLGSGMPIAEVNSVRKHVSTIKGGRLAEMIEPARIINLTVSDVAGDTLDIITDPTVPDTSTTADAISVLQDYGLWESLPVAIIEHLESAKAESPDLSDASIDTHLLVTGKRVCDAMVTEASSQGLKPVILTTTLEGEAREMGRFIADLALSSSHDGYPFSPGTVLLGCGSENAVAIGDSGAFGEGGPGQEAALAASLELDGAPIAALFMDTDGSDGGTDVAGAIADGETAKRAVNQGLDLRQALLRHTARLPLGRLHDLIETGPTGTNVNDLFVVVIGEESK